MTIRIRDARLPGDADQLARIFVSSAEHHVGLDPVLYRVPDVRAVADRYRAYPVDDGGRAVLVAEVADSARAAGHVAGFATVTMLPRPGTASMLADVPAASVDVAVLPSHRGRGVGSQLMRAAAERARRLGAARLQLDAHCDNKGALRLYRALGYRPMGLLLTRRL